MSDQVQALPIKSFEYGGIIRNPRGGTFFADRRVAQQLESMGMLRIVKQTEDPLPAAGEQQSASPAAQVLPQTTSSASEGGVRRGRPRKQGASS